MTEAKKKNKQQSNDNRISTHPSYTEYSWDSLVGTDNQAGAAAAAISTPTAGKTASGNVKGANVKRSAAVGTAGRTAGNAGRVRARGDVHTGEAKRTAATAPVGTSTAVGVSEKANGKVKPAAKPKVKSKTSILTIASERKYAFPLSVVLLALGFTVLIMAVVTTAVQINEITTVNSGLEGRYNAMVSEENELKLLLETRDDLRVVERMAQEELGMVKTDEVERYTLTVHQEDKIEIIEEVKEERTGILDGIADFGNSIVERVRGFFGM